jgi:hypothetical protein
VTDNNAWQPPSGEPLPSAGQFAPPASPYGPPQNAHLPAPQYGQPTPGWTPPPKPGLIPLRPLSFGTLLGASFQVIRRNPRPTFGISLLLNGFVILLFVGVIGGVTAIAFSRAASATSADADEIEAGAIGAIVLSALIPVALSLLVTAILQGIISLEVSRATIGEKLTVRGLWRLARGRIGALVGWSALVTVAILVAIVVVALIVTALVAFGGDAGLVVGIILGILAGLGGIVVWAWLATKLSLVPSVLMLERVPLRQAVARSWRLTSGYGYFWKALGTQLLVYVIVQVAAQVVVTPISILAAVGGSTINPNGDMTASVVVLVVSYILTGIVSLVFGALAAVAQSAVAALIYIDFRMRKEGLDLDLTRFVEARQVGDVGVANPYLRTS